MFFLSYKLQIKLPRKKIAKKNFATQINYNLLNKIHPIKFHKSKKIYTYIKICKKSQKNRHDKCGDPIKLDLIPGLVVC